MTILYHYTDEESKKLIEKSGTILQSKLMAHRRDAAFGDGVYLTSFPPTKTTKEILGNNYDGMTPSKALAMKTEWYFEFESDDLSGVEYVGKGQHRDVWLYRDNDLAIVGKAKKRTV